MEADSRVNGSSAWERPEFVTGHLCDRWTAFIISDEFNTSGFGRFTVCNFRERNISWHE
jgi:hypothetical protein